MPWTICCCIPLPDVSKNFVARRILIFPTLSAALYFPTSWKPVCGPRNHSAFWGKKRPLTYGVPPEFRGGVPIYLFKPPYAIRSVPSLSGQYRWRSLPRVRRHRARKPEGSSERVLPWKVTMDQLICASLSHTHYNWYEVGMLKVPAIYPIDAPNLGGSEDAMRARLARRRERYGTMLSSISASRIRSAGTPSKNSTGNEYVFLLVADLFINSRHAETYALSADEKTAKGCAAKLVHDYIPLPQRQRSRVRVHDLLGNLPRARGLKEIYSSSAHPQTNGMVERLNHTMCQMPSHLVHHC